MISMIDFIHAGQLTISNILLANYAKLGMNSEEMMLWIQLSRKAAQGDVFPDLTPLAQEMGITQERIYLLLNQLVEKELLVIQSNVSEDGKRSDYYDLTKIYEKLEAVFTKIAQEEKQKNNQESQINLYQSFEEEFGRPLSPMEYQQIAQWLDEDHYQPELILIALREAVLNQAYSLKYVDRILLSWERKNIKTKEQVQKEQQRRKEIMMQKEEQTTTSEPLPKVTLVNWLKEDTRDK